MEIIMRWIQLSDIHFQTKTPTYNTKQLRDKLPAYLKKLGQFDAMLITGDYRYAPDGEKNPTKVVEYMKDLAHSINIETQNIVTVPGNHDLTRNGVRKAMCFSVSVASMPVSRIRMTI